MADNDFFVLFLSSPLFLNLSTDCSQTPSFLLGFLLVLVVLKKSSGYCPLLYEGSRIALSVTHSLVCSSLHSFDRHDKLCPPPASFWQSTEPLLA
ncbi:hypothetical protein BS17DRAFT_780335 [Gyrodon lividus]|nr:hypothetical protein BS17DRAFT_780335 [Gyrodon lividus]